MNWVFFVFLEKCVFEWFMGLGEVFWLPFVGHLVQCWCIRNIPTAAFISGATLPSLSYVG